MRYVPLYLPTFNLYFWHSLPTVNVEYLAYAFPPENFCKPTRNSWHVLVVSKWISWFPKKKLMSDIVSWNHHGWLRFAVCSYYSLRIKACGEYIYIYVYFKVLVYTKKCFKFKLSIWNYGRGLCYPLALTCNISSFLTKTFRYTYNTKTCALWLGIFFLFL